MRSSPSGLVDDLLSPAPDPARIGWLSARPFAHRGLHGPHVPENSRAAFAAAVAAGHGIELDVRLSRDGEAMVFHDATLDRLAGRPGELGSLQASQLAQVRLSGSEETIPTLREVLALVAGRVPILIEVKAGPRLAALCQAVSRALDGYGGRHAVMSFHPDVGRWYARHAPVTVRGLVVTEQGKRWRGAAERKLALWRARPDFLAYDIKDLPSRFAAFQRARGLPVLTWTCRADAERERAARWADQIIYEVPPGQ